MPISKVYLNDDYNVVPQDQATQAAETELDDQGNLVGERWIRIVKPGSMEADRIAIEKEASRIAVARSNLKVWSWVIILLLIVTLGYLWFVLR